MSVLLTQGSSDQGLLSDAVGSPFCSWAQAEFSSLAFISSKADIHPPPPHRHLLHSLLLRILKGNEYDYMNSLTLQHMLLFVLCTFFVLNRLSHRQNPGHCLSRTEVVSWTYCLEERKHHSLLVHSDTVLGPVMWTGSTAPFCRLRRKGGE